MLHLLTDGGMKDVFDDFRPLNLHSPPPHAFRSVPDGWQVYDVIRRRWLQLTPEEWVRQHLVAELLSRGFPPVTLALEKAFSLYGLAKRFDLAVFGAEGILLLAECKSPDVLLNEEVLAQALRYNQRFKSPAILITNGIDHHFYTRSIDIYYLTSKSIPDFVELKKIATQF
ncbi:restriction endonuclease subunit R [Thermaurantimonas aggregans]|uniref:Restriction endonuclease subunit R n=1 Tax=Thermaurantimonas aggregans TaxID=2173829 RepID=A0A401XIS9_9FLAO|nr:type I restriction enzyme HsdR N-terminal domain-containing protein [Thermaurantimonas aggregans]MCX8148817.1 type I restriction enzyme HsdR N-terminal domain-containing protein [Thermaurantimonas aggregans]GCD76874.1 restriction endonuclease subunit R [Thermaurantimonas aggregans]